MCKSELIFCFLFYGSSLFGNGQLDVPTFGLGADKQTLICSGFSIKSGIN